MQQRRWHRATPSVVGALALTAALSVTATPALADPQKPTPVSVFPSDSLTVADPGQITGRRVDLPTDDCGAPISCGLVQQLNQLDGFDLDPRIAVRFTRPVDPAQAAAGITVQGPDGRRIGVDRVVWDPSTKTLYAHPAEQLAPATTYRLRVGDGPGNRSVEDTFTTLSATDGLLDLRRQIDDGSAFAAAGVTPGLRVDGVFPATGTTVSLVQDSSTTGADTTAVVPVPQAATDGTLVFGSYEAPSWLRPDVTIAQTPTEDAGPAPLGEARLPFVAVLPAGPTPPGGWPTAVFGHGFTRSTADVFIAAAVNSRSGIATIATNVVGHGYGPASTWQVSSGGTTTSLPAYGRGVDQNTDGAIGSTEGSSATGAAAAQSSRDALRQTSADVMTLVRSLGGTDVDGNGTPDLSGREVTYFGQSFGGIYGTMVTGADPAIARSVLNVPGGPITEIARLSPAFRNLTTESLRAAGLLNSDDPTRNHFQEQMPLRGEGPVTVTVPGAVAIQEYLARSTWLSRPGSPETFSPLIAPERAVFQIAYGDQTVPNPTSYTVIDAGDLWSRTSLYRNDRTPQAAINPHGFLLNLAEFPVAGIQGQTQVAAFLGRGEVVDPDQGGDVWEVPISDPALLLPLNFPQPALRP
ncbi:Ig-like domain-containing protein [Geodermatophilus maliterrae]|uniref:Ig-like domain-containing protein n=1 Tax=Geodermatophilus maliterrae TaxID=3162531 RepID=A0ABV3XJ16_9ACTN